MAIETNIIGFSGDGTGTQQELSRIAQAAELAEKRVLELEQALAKTLCPQDLSTYSKMVTRYGKEMADSFRSLRVRVSLLKTAFTDAAMPLAGVFIPILNRALTSVTRFTRNVGAVLHALFGSEDGENGLAQQAEDASASGEKLKRTYTSAGKAIKRSLASFDQIDRLGSGSGSGSGGSSQAVSAGGLYDYQLSAQAENAVNKLRELLAPLQKLDFSRVVGSLARLKDAAAGLGSTVQQALKWAWFHILVPLAGWSIQKAAPALLDNLSAALKLLGSVLEPVGKGLGEIGTALKPVISYIAGTAVLILDKWAGRFSELAAVFQEKGPEIVEIFHSIGRIISNIWEQVAPILEKLRAHVSGVFDGIWRVVTNCISGVITCIASLSRFLAQFFTGDLSGAFQTLLDFMSLWSQSVGRFLRQAFDSAVQAVLGILQTLGDKITWVFQNSKRIVKDSVNGIIGFINSMLSGLASGINGIVQMLNKIQIKIPSWVPGYGGKQFGFNLSTVRAPKIPYLAQGAVLPANKPFLAVVGDQKHGTNVEAPLETIRQAMAQVLAQQGGGNITINFTGDLAQLGRVLKPVIQRENQRIGASLAREVAG